MVAMLLLLFYRAVLRARECECSHLIAARAVSPYKQVMHYSFVVAYDQKTFVHFGCLGQR